MKQCRTMRTPEIMRISLAIYVAAVLATAAAPHDDARSIIVSTP
jgi:hypothetical protein